MSNEIEKRKFEELKAMFEPEDFEFLQNNLDSDDPEVREKIAEIYARNNYFGKLLSNKFFFSEENLLNMATKGPTQKAVVQHLLGRMLDNEDHWDVPDYRYASMEVHKDEAGLTYNDLYLGALGWHQVDSEDVFTKFVGDRKDCRIHFNTPEQKITIEKDGFLFDLDYLELFALLQKARELGMSKPPTYQEIFKRF